MDNVILVIGGGSIGKRHIKNLKGIGQSTILCLKRKEDPDFEKEFGVKVIVSEEEAMRYDFKAVFACNPTSLHNDCIKLAKIKNTAIFMEKPLIDSVKGLENTKALLKDFNNVFFIGFMLRFHPLVKRIKEIINSNVLGKVYSARFEFGSFLPYWHPWEDYKMSYAARKNLGGGVINTITHELDLIQYFFGEPDTVFCNAKNYNKLNIDVEELCEAIFEYNDKVVTLHLDYLQKDYDRNIKILCDDGKIIWNWHENKIYIIKHKEEPYCIQAENFDVNQLYIDELKYFFNLLETKQRKHPLDQFHAISNTSIMLLMHESCRVKSKVKVKNEINS